MLKLKPELRKALFLPILLLHLWVPLYIYLQPISDFIVDTIFQMQPESHLAESLRFFIFEVPKVFMLLILIIFGVGIIRTYFTPEKTRKALAGKSAFTGNVLAALLGVVTPFCTCSAIPLFIGFVEAGVPIGVTFSFLVAAPMVNEIALILLVGLFGWQTALIYAVTGLAIAIFSGWLIGKLKMEKYVEEWVFKAQGSQLSQDKSEINLSDRIKLGFTAVKEIVGKIWIYILIGIGIGAAAHGYVPENYLANLMGKDVWYAVPLSILIGVPLYSNAAGIIPIVSVLIEKGVSLGTALAFMMSVIGLSLPELIILKKILKMPLILTFVGVVATGILLVGFIFNFIY